MTAALVLSAVQAEPWARALEVMLARYGPTPIYDALVAEFAAKSEPRRRDERGRFA